MPAAKRARASSTTVTVRTPAKAKAVRASVPRPFSFKGKNPRYTGFPEQLAVRHKYVGAITLTSSTGLFTSTLFSANGMYDPFITGGGGQPLYFDQCAALYDHYTVMASKIRVTAAVNGSTSGPQVYVALITDDDTNTNFTNVADVISDDCKSWGVTGGVANKPLVLYQNFNATKTYGVKDIPGDSTMSGTSSANPSEQTYYRICMNECGFSTTATVNLMIEIEYDAIWRERKDQVPS